jgi:hypothetical protein
MSEETKRGSADKEDSTENPRIPGVETGSTQKPVSPEEAQNQSMGRSEDHTSLKDRGTMDDEDVDRVRPPRG